MDFRSSSLSHRLAQIEPLLYVFVLLAYFLPWIDHPAAGLTLIGLDVSEWVKFLPQMASGELPNRDFLYLPPVFLGGCLAVYSLSAGGSGAVAWVIRLSAVGVSLLAFPSLDAIRFEGQDQWLPRLIWILIVGLFSLVVVPQVAGRLSEIGRGRLHFLGLLLFGLAGAVFPAITLLPTRRVAAEWLNLNLTTGSGFWLSAAGFGGLAILAAVQLWRSFGKSK